MTTPPERQMGASDFKIEWAPATKTTETLRWSIQRSKFEIHVIMLEQVELNDIVPHCLGMLHKIDGQVGLDNDHRRVTSYLQVLPRTMSMPLQAYWKQVLMDYDETHEDTITTNNDFNAALRAFFAGHATEDDRYDLVESLRSASKPETMKFQTFFYRIKELNDYVEWLPGQEEKLSKSQLNLALYNGLPGSWQAKYMITGRSVHTDNRPDLLRYLRVQEHQQGIIDSKNQVLRAKARAKLECGREILSRRAAQRAKVAEKMRSKRAGAKHQRGEPGSSKTKVNVRPEDPCPIHLMAGHTWSECYSNAGRYKDAKKIMGATTKVQNKKKEKEQEGNVAAIALATDRVINDDESFISDGELMEVCCGEQLDVDLMETTAAD
jgi:hypothetical protein